MTASSASAPSFSRERSTTDPRDLLRPGDSGSASAPLESILDGCAGMCPSCRGANWSCFRLVDFLAVRSSDLLSVSFVAPAGSKSMTSDVPLCAIAKDKKKKNLRLFGINLMRSQELSRAAQEAVCPNMTQSMLIVCPPDAINPILPSPPLSLKLTVLPFIWLPGLLRPWREGRGREGPFGGRASDRLALGGKGKTANTSSSL